VLWNPKTGTIHTKPGCSNYSQHSLIGKTLRIWIRKSRDQKDPPVKHQKEPWHFWFGCPDAEFETIQDQQHHQLEAKREKDSGQVSTAATENISTDSIWKRWTLSEWRGPRQGEERLKTLGIELQEEMPAGVLMI
jgi:hypothetical protein